MEKDSTKTQGSLLLEIIQGKSSFTKEIRNPAESVAYLDTRKSGLSNLWAENWQSYSSKLLAITRESRERYFF
jgi:hypothetical protein